MASIQDREAAEGVDLEDDVWGGDTSGGPREALALGQLQYPPPLIDLASQGCPNPSESFHPLASRPGLRSRAVESPTVWRLLLRKESSVACPRFAYAQKELEKLRKAQQRKKARGRSTRSRISQYVNDQCIETGLVPTWKEIAAEVNASRRTVAYHMSALKKLEEIPES